jgi:hypothetical protein
MSNTVVAIGSNQLWAFSPAIDLLERFPPPPPAQITQTDANAGATPAPAPAPAPAAASASSSGKSGVSSALARLLLAASAPPAASATAASNDLSGRGALSMLLVDSGDILSAFKTIVRSHAHRAPGADKDTPLDVSSRVLRRHGRQGGQRTAKSTSHALEAFLLTLSSRSCMHPESVRVFLG